MKSNRKIPYGWPVIVLAIVAGLTMFSLSPRINHGGGYEFLDTKAGAVITVALGVALLVAGVIFLVNSFLVEKDLKGPEAEREKEYRDANNRL